MRNFKIFANPLLRGTEPVFLGEVQGKNFADACVNLAVESADFRTHFDRDKLTFWGTELYWRNAEQGAA